MKILIIRHADPDYSIDSLTPKGWVEAECLSEKLIKMDIKAFYTSTLGRAKDTASLTLKKLGREPDGVFEWLKEFPPVINRPDCGRAIAWDWLPADWTVIDEFYDKDKWGTVTPMAEGKVKEEYDRVVEEFDLLLAKHGYVREGNYYRAEKPNMDTIAIFCHFGSGCVLLSHLLGVSPMVLWHGLCAAPSSVTTLTTEERREGIAAFRMNGYGDVSHLYAKDEQPAFAARFCEMYTNQDERHD
ncbi:MAG: histidine phosphatase family protein [Clostridia bacterium]|nr:histidine phosphatase family protein [Clostridia bacterium]